MTTTATQWLNDHPGDVGILDEMLLDSGVNAKIITEYPDWMKKDIGNQLAESFSQPYWKEISETTLGDAERYIQQGLEDGWSIRRMADTMSGSFAGSTAKYAKMRATRIARTESANALNGSRKASMNQAKEELPNEVSDFMRPLWHSVLGDTTRDSHAFLDGVPADEEGMWTLAGVRIPWPAHYTLPVGERVNCFPVGTLVSGDFVGAQRAWYEGIFTEIILSKGGRITLTPNHPIVTREGLIPASEIKPGQKVMTYDTKVNSPSMMAASSNEIENKPASVEQIFETFLSASTRAGGIEICSSQINDFYGDGESIQGNVEIVWANWKLLEDGIVGKFEKCGNSIFVFENQKLFLESGLGSSTFTLNSVLGTSSGLPSSPQGTIDVFGRFEITPSGSLAVGVAANFNTSLNQSTRQDGPSISSFLRESLQRHSRFVSFDDVVKVQNFYSAGHVYDLQSVQGLVVAFDPLYHKGIGIVTSNCQCSIIMSYGMQPNDARQLIEEGAERERESAEKPGPKISRLSASISFDKNDRVAMREVFGKEITNEQAKQLAGVPMGGGGNVTVSTIKSETGKGFDVFFQYEDKKAGVFWDTLIAEKELEIVSAEVKRKGVGIGSKITRDQLKIAQELGIKKATLSAERSKSLVGYYVWPRLGFDAKLPKAWKIKHKKNPIIEGLRGPSTISNLMGTPEGRQFWKDKGVGIRMEMSLAPKSKQFQILEEFVQDKGN